jgi:hypothetical protein
MGDRARLYPCFFPRKPNAINARRQNNPTGFALAYNARISCREANGTNGHLARETRFERDAMEVREDENSQLRQAKEAEGPGARLARSARQPGTNIRR